MCGLAFGVEPVIKRWVKNDSSSGDRSAGVFIGFRPSVALDVFRRLS